MFKNLIQSLLPIKHFAQPGDVSLPADAPKSHICIVGGTNIASALTRTEYIKGSFVIDTPHGPSPDIYYGEVDGVAFYHILVHGTIGVDRHLLDGETTALLRTWSAMYQLGVTEVLGGATAGSINSAYSNGDWVIPNDFIDWNISRPRSIAYTVMGDEAKWILPRMNPASDPEIDRILYEACCKHAPQVKTWKDAVMGQSSAGRFETVAEVKMMQMHGCDIASHNIATEMAYARQLSMNYGSFNGVVNPAEGMGHFALDMIDDFYPQMHQQSIKIYMDAVPKVAALKGKPRVIDSLVVHPELED